MGGYSSKLIFFDGMFILIAQVLTEYRPGTLPHVLDHPRRNFCGYRWTLKNICGGIPKHRDILKKPNDHGEQTGRRYKPVQISR